MNLPKCQISGMVELSILILLIIVILFISILSLKHDPSGDKLENWKRLLELDILKFTL